MLQVAYFSPLPPQRTGVADYSAELLPYLAELAEITVYTPDPGAVPSELSRRLPIVDLARYPSQRWRHDVALYHMGNSRFHRQIYTLLRRYPGVTVLHDHVLHHFLLQSTLGQGDFPGYVRELAYAHGREGQARAHAILRGERPAPCYRWPLSRRVVDLSLGVVVHSAVVRRRVLAASPRARVAKINHLLPLPALRDRQAVRARLDLPPDAFVVVTAGLLTAEKRPEVMLDAFQRFHRRHPRAVWLVVGQALEGDAAWERATEGLGAALRYLGYVEGLDAFYDALAAGDVCVSLRHPTAGETSGAVLRAMAVGQPVVVSDLGWYAELPDDCCPKVDHDGREADQLHQILEHLFAQPTARAAMGQHAREYVARACDPRRVARDYVAFLESVLASLVGGG